jgi:hypothetical protein
LYRFAQIKSKKPSFYGLFGESKNEGILEEHR